MTPAATRRIRELNDAFRAAGPAGGDWMITDGIQASGPEFVVAALAIVVSFACFNPHNDPHGEHDFGCFALSGQKVFWKIDYYDRSLQFGSPEPSNPNLTRRVLAVMRADEY